MHMSNHLRLENPFSRLNLSTNLIQSIKQAIPNTSSQPEKGQIHGFSYLPGQVLH